MPDVTDSSRAQAPKMPAKLAQVAPFPAVAMKLLSLFASENCSFSSIASCIGTDAALSARFIRRANAADRRTYCEAKSILQAVAALGMDLSRELSLSMITSDYARAGANSETLRPCWHHTVASAQCAAEIARHCGLRPAEVYTAALLHDIGRLGMIAAYSSEYEAVVAEAAGNADGLIRREREFFGVDHVQAGEWLALRWGLPASIQEVIVRHQEEPKAPLDLVGVVHIACRVADILGFGLTKYEQVPDVNEATATLPEWARARLKSQLPALRESILREIQLFEGADEQETAEAGRETVAEFELEPAMETAPSMNSRSSRLLISGALVAGIVVASVIAYSLQR